MIPASDNAHDSTGDSIPEHTRPNASRLEAFRVEIAVARQRNWPFRAIATMLKERHGLTISPRAICGFCQCRGIEKGIGETREEQLQPAPPSVASVSSNPAVRTADILAPKPRRKKKPFTYVDGPLRTRANGLLKDE